MKHEKQTATHSFYEFPIRRLQGTTKEQQRATTDAVQWSNSLNVKIWKRPSSNPLCTHHTSFTSQRIIHVIFDHTSFFIIFCCILSHIIYKYCEILWCDIISQVAWLFYIKMWPTLIRDVWNFPYQFYYKALKRFFFIFPLFDYSTSQWSFPSSDARNKSFGVLLYRSWRFFGRFLPARYFSRRSLLVISVGVLYCYRNYKDIVTSWFYYKKRIRKITLSILDLRYTVIPVRAMIYKTKCSGRALRFPVTPIDLMIWIKKCIKDQKLVEE